MLRDWPGFIIITVNLFQLGNYFYLNPLLFSLLSLQFSPHISLCGERANSCVVYSCHLELSHDSVDGYSQLDKTYLLGSTERDFPNLPLPDDAQY